MGLILKNTGFRKEAERRFNQALEIFTSLDQVENMKKCEKYIASLQMERND